MDPKIPTSPLPSGAWCVTQCACGHIVLHLGAVERVFTRTEFAQLHRLLAEAMEEFDIPPTTSEVLRRRAVTH